MGPDSGQRQTVAPQHIRPGRASSGAKAGGHVIAAADRHPQWQSMMDCAWALKRRHGRAPVGNVCASICSLLMQREGRQWTQTTRALWILWFLFIIANPVLTVTCPHCPHALRPCRVARNRSRGRHVVFVAQCNGWVLHCNLASQANIIPPSTVAWSSQTDPWATREEGPGGGGKKEKERKKETGGEGVESSCMCSSPTSAPVKRIEHIGRAR